MLKTPVFVLVAGLVVAGAAANGLATQRWAFAAPDPAVTDRLHALEVRFDDWQSAEVPTDMPTNERSTATSRRYTSPTTGRSAVVTIISGIPGSVSTHTPDVCYPGAGYKTVVPPKKETVELPGGRTAEVYVADFEKTTQSKRDRVRVRWAWSTDGGWVAPDRPRWQFAARLAKAPELYKLYVATPAPADGDDRPDDEPATKGFVAAALGQFGAGFGR
ncbi:MAG: exosortase-associated EpsI family protein [Gemmataceae bacterium]|nr:exosortase-associated EpsI family protein [Gemmataceae bacterium]